jgi:hypothetical protein
MGSYPEEIYYEIKKLFIRENKTATEISGIYNKKPPEQTISLWAKQKDKKGKTWYDLRMEFRDKQYAEVSPKSLANKILQRINEIMNEDWTDKTADQLVKLQSSLEKLTSAKYQVPVMYYMLSEYVDYMRKYHKKMVSKKFLETIRDFKNYLRSRLES